MMPSLAIIVRIVHAFVTLLGLTLLVFLAVRVTGDPLQLLLPDTASAEDFERLRSQLGLDQPLYRQYIGFIGDLLQGDLGTSLRLRIPVSEIIERRLPNTFLLGGVAIVIALAIGIPLGVYAAYWRGGWVDRIARGAAILSQSAPIFWIGILLIIFFAVRLRWLPAGGSGSVSYIVLPAVTLALAPIAGLTRLVRSAMIEVLETDYIKFLRAKGEPEWSVLWKHGLRNASLSALTYIGVITAGLVTGSLVVEAVFVWPGIGQAIAEAIESRDFPVVQGVVLVLAVIVIFVNLLVDVFYTLLNPRLRT